MSIPADQVARVRPPLGSLAALLYNQHRGADVLAAGGLQLGERDLSFITGLGLALQWEIIAGLPVDHGTVADEAALLALHDDSADTPTPRWVKPGDIARRTDRAGYLQLCTAGHGTTAAQWAETAQSSALAALASDWAAALSAGLATKAAATHSHALDDITGLVSALAAKQAVLANAALLGEFSEGVGGALLYGGEPVALGSQVVPIAYSEIDWGGTDYTYASDGDANGVIHAIGVAAGGGVWTNPHTAGAVVITAYGGVVNLPPLVNRSDDDAYTSDGGAPDVSYFQIDLGATRATRVNRYSLRGSSYGYNLPRTWLLLGSNDGSTWTTIDARTADTTVGQSTWGTFAPNGDTANYYRYLRLLCHGLDSGGTYRMRAGEFEVYGRVLASTAPANPSWANTWMTDSAGHYWPAVATG